MTITREQYLMGREKEYPTTEDIEVNVARLLYRVNRLLDACSYAGVVSSGYRPGRYNAAAGGAARSAHLTGEAIDVADATGSLKKLITEELLTKYNLYMEDPARTPTWCHLQTRATSVRIFRP